MKANKYFLFLFLFLFSFTATFGQGISVSNAMPKTIVWQKSSFVVDSIFRLGISKLQKPTWWNDIVPFNGAMVLNSADSQLYWYYNGWKKAIGVPTDTSSLSNRIDARVKYVDTMEMLMPYAKLSKVLSDSATLGSAISLRVKYSDTAAMLSPYAKSALVVKYTDTATMLSGYVKGSVGVKYSDTAFMLYPYLRKLDTASLSARINAKGSGTITSISTLNGTGITGGTITTSGTLSIDTTLLSTRLWRQKAVDSINTQLALKIKYTDTSAMLSPYINNVNYGLSKTGQIASVDTATLSNKYFRVVDTANKWVNSVIKINDSTIRVIKNTTSTDITLTPTSTVTSATRLITAVYNNSGATILKGSVVYMNGAHSSNLPTIALAKANAEATSAFTYGLVQDDIPDNNQGIVIQNGSITNLNLPTSTYTAGQTLYLSPTVAGGYTTTKPLAPNHYVAIGTITRAHPTFGTIQVAIRNGFQLDELSDVQIPLYPNDSTLLQYSRTDSLWHSVSVTTAIANKYIKPSDTAAMLVPYAKLTKVLLDSNALASNINLRVKYTDTASLVAPYLRKVDTSTLSTRINLKLNISDTAAMLFPYLRDADTASMLSPYARKQSPTIITPSITGLSSGTTNDSLVVADATTGALKRISSSRISSGGGGGGTPIYKLASQTLTAAGWSASGGYYQYTFSNAYITTSSFIIFTPNNASINEVSTSMMLPQIDVAAGTCTFYTSFPPQNNIVGDIVIFTTL